jgi:hypothetical protein
MPSDHDPASVRMRCGLRGRIRRLRGWSELRFGMLRPLLINGVAIYVRGSSLNGSEVARDWMRTVGCPPVNF